MLYIFHEANECNNILSQNYNRFSILAVFITFGILIYTAWTLHYIKEYNKIQSETQNSILKQSRLIELSHEWNSQYFIAARNRAALIKRDFQGKEPTIYPAFANEQKIEEWQYISALAHFFERLSYIQLSGQINKEHAMAEFKEAIDYWHDFLFIVYCYDGGDEERLRTALTKLKIEYAKSAPEN
ncbi:hypothetical protein [Agrobacterium larrymoorei]|nr:hypothetical protein [Agrobacterium larrymoorei]